MQNRMYTFHGKNYSINETDEGSNTPLILAIKNKEYPITIDELDELIQNTRYINHQANNKDTALTWAAYYNNARTVKKLLEARANINIQGSQGGTALFWAANNQSNACVGILIEARADVNIKSASHETALSLFARKNSSKYFILKLIIAGAIPGKTDDQPIKLFKCIQSYDIRHNKALLALKKLCDQQNNLFKREKEDFTEEELKNANHYLEKLEKFNKLHKNNFNSRLQNIIYLPTVLLNIIQDYLCLCHVPIKGSKLCKSEQIELYIAEEEKIAAFFNPKLDKKQIVASSKKHSPLEKEDSLSKKLKLG